MAEVRKGGNPSAYLCVYEMDKYYLGAVKQHNITELSEGRGNQQPIMSTQITGSSIANY